MSKFNEFKQIFFNELMLTSKHHITTIHFNLPV